jgi:hypothetical protein
MEGVRAAIGRYTVDLIASHSLVDSCQLREDVGIAATKMHSA